MTLWIISAKRKKNMNFKYLDVTATVRIRSTIKGKPLTETENYSCKTQVMAMAYPKSALDSIVKADVHLKFEELFRERLKKDAKLRNAIGGIKWSVDVSSVQYEAPQELLAA